MEEGERGGKEEGKKKKKEKRNVRCVWPLSVVLPMLLLDHGQLLLNRNMQLHPFIVWMADGDNTIHVR